MRTTLNLDDRLMREAKRRAAEEGTTLTRLVELALRSHLRPREPESGGFSLELLTKRGRTLPGVDFDDRDSLYERMEDRG